MLTLVLVWAIMGVAWNVFSGYSGLVSFGHASFFGLGAYTVALLLMKLELTPWIGIPIGMLVGVAAGVLIGYPTFRLRGVYFALAMLAYPLALLYVFEWLGYQEVPLPMKREAPAAYMQFSDHRAYVVIALVMLVAAMIVSLRIERSRFGLSLIAIKQNEWAAEASGIDTWRWKMKAIMVSGAIAAAAGGFYAVVLLIVTPPTVFGMLTSAQALIVTLFGGVATVWGPVIGAIILIPLAEILHAELGDKIPGIQGVVFGAAIVAVIMLAPEGLVPKFRDARARRARGPDDARPALDEPVAAAPAARRAVGEEVVLRVANVSRSFGGLRAVQDVSFDVRRGEVLGIIGPNGAGKTTLFNLLNGFIRADAGEVLFEGKSLLGLKTNAICRLGIGRTFQVMRPFPRMSVLDNVVVGAFAAESDDARAYAAARDALARVGLAARGDDDRRRSDDGRAAPDGARACDRLAAEGAARRRDARRARLAGDRPPARYDQRARERRADDRDHRAHDARDGAARRPAGGPRPRRGARHRRAGGGHAQPESRRGVPRQAVDGPCSALTD
jgi:branched-chain amino acid transport system permease protein